MVALHHLEKKGKDFMPADLAKELGLTVKEVSPVLKEYPGIFRKEKNNPKYYNHSIWGFRRVEV
jgi:hypothetical protein